MESRGGQREAVRVLHPLAATVQVPSLTMERLRRRGCRGGEGLVEEERTWPRETVEEEGPRWRELAMVEESPWRWNRACVCAGGREAGKAGPAPSSHALPADQGPAGEVFVAKAEEKGRTTVGGRSREARAVPSWWSGPAGERKEAGESGKDW